MLFLQYFIIHLNLGFFIQNFKLIQAKETLLKHER